MILKFRIVDWKLGLVYIFLEIIVIADFSFKSIILWKVKVILF